MQYIPLYMANNFLFFIFIIIYLLSCLLLVCLVLFDRDHPKVSHRIELYSAFKCYLGLDLTFCKLMFISTRVITSLVKGPRDPIAL